MNQKLIVTKIKAALQSTGVSESKQTTIINNIVKSLSEVDKTNEKLMKTKKDKHKITGHQIRVNFSKKKQDKLLNEVAEMKKSFPKKEINHKQIIKSHMEKMNRYRQVERKVMGDMKKVAKKYYFLFHYKVQIRDTSDKEGAAKEEWKSGKEYIKSIHKDTSLGNVSQYDEEVFRQKVHQKYEAYNVNVLQIKIKDITPINNEQYENIQLGAKSLSNMFLEKLNGYVEKKFDDNLCVERFVLSEIKQVRGFKKYDKERLRRELSTIGVVSDKITSSELIEWVKRYHPQTISVFAIDPVGKVYQSYICGKHHLITLAFVNNNSHCYPITNHEMKNYISKAKKIDFGEIKWDTHASKYKKIEKLNISNNSLDEGINQQNNNNYNDLVAGKLNNKEIALIENNLLDVASEIINYTGYQVVAFKHLKSEINAFQHPLNGQIIEHAPDYEERKFVCDKLFKLYPYYPFQFKNQSYGSMVKDLFELLFGKIPLKSYHIKEDLELYDKFHTKPMVRTLVNNHEYNKNCQGFDIAKSYSNAMKNMQLDYYVFSICDEFKNYDGRDIVAGDYLIDEVVIESLDCMKIDRQIVSYNLVLFLLERKYITKKQILKYKKASYVISKNQISEFIKVLENTFPQDESKYYKIMANTFSGMLGKRFSTLDQGFVTNDYATMCASFFQYHEQDNYEWAVETLNDYHFIRVTHKKRLESENAQIYRQILSQGMIQLIELAERVMKKDSKLIGYNTDSIFVENPKKFTILPNKTLQEYTQYREEEWHPKNYKDCIDENIEIDMTDIKINYQTLDDSNVEKLKNKSFVCIGGGGCGKSTMAKQIYDLCEPEKVLVLCYTNKACQNLIQKGMDRSRVFTFSSYFQDNEKVPDYLTNIFVDEFSMMPQSWLRLLYKLKLNNKNLTIQLYGDPNQCKQVCEFNRYFAYLEKKCFAFITDSNKIVKPYIEASARYDKELHKVVEEFLRTGRMPKELMNRPINDSLDTNVVWSNKTRDHINDKFGKEWFVGMKLICEKNDKKLNIYNSMMYYITRLTKTHVAVSESLNDKELECGLINRKYFRPASACTVFKYQGGTIETPFNILDTDRMDRNELYTALTRARRLDQIYIKYSNRFYKLAHEDDEPTYMTYQEGKEGYIYKLTNEKHNKVYVGMTTGTIEKRLKEHLDLPTDPLNKYDGEWKHEQLAVIKYFDEKELRKLEKLYIVWMHDEGNDLINTQNIPKLAKKYEPNVNAGNYDEDIIKKVLEIKEYSKYYRITETYHGKLIDIKKRFGKNKTKEQAFDQITKIRESYLL